MNLYQTDGKVWRRKLTSSGSEANPHYQTWWRYRYGMANGTGFLVFIDDVTADRSRRMNRVQIRQHFTAQTHNDPQQTARSFMRPIKWIFFNGRESPDLHPTEQLLKMKLEAETQQQQLRVAAETAWKSIWRDETEPIGSRLQALTDCKGSHPSAKNKPWNSNNFWTSENGNNV